MRQSYNVDAIDRKDKITAGPEWAERDVVAMWHRIEEKSKETGISYTKAGRKYGFSPSGVYNTIARVKRGLPPRDTDLRIIEALAKEMDVPLNYLVHGEKITSLEKADTDISESELNNIFALGEGSFPSIFLMVIPFLTDEELESIRSDILTRFK